ncbi:hypothetical protein TGCOUG_396240 [Toxoplasma gondii COUG]|uniref:Uncharacterized protein n=1 Tax=Toxoplasma gondii COUG TaxID=1074873 RepID=A0A2G8XLT6_TOXGO|nr:hypothetical protein TGCOUG_396240 [Toxoplasma gondii COUG]
MQTHGRDEGKSGWPSGRPASVDEGSQPGPPPTQQPTYLRLAHSGRRLVTGEPQASPSGDEGVAQRSGQEEEEAEEGEIREMLAWLRGMMGEGQGEASASADSQGASGGFADAQTPSRGEGESVWMSGRLGGVDEGSGSGRPPAHQLPHALSVYSGRDMVGVDDQITSPGDEGVPHLVPEALDDEQLQEMRRWLEGTIRAHRQTGHHVASLADTSGMLVVGGAR